MDHTRKCLPATSIDNRGHADWDGSVVFHQSHRFPGRSSGGDDVVDDESLLSLTDPEAAPKPHDITLAFREDCPATEASAELVSDDDGAHGRGNDQVGFFRAHEGSQSVRTPLGVPGPLQDLGALEVLRTVKSRTEQEVSFHEGSGIGEDLPDVV